MLGDGAVVVRWQLGGGDTLMLAANLAQTPAPGFPAESGRVLWQEGEAGEDGTFGPWTVRWSVEQARLAEPASNVLDELAERMGDLDLIESKRLDGAPLERRRLMLESGLPWGYRRLAIEPGDASFRAERGEPAPGETKKHV